MANIKLSKAEISKREAAANEQNNDFFSALSNLGSETEETETNNTVTRNYVQESDESEEEIPVIKKSSIKTVTRKNSEEKPGYISLVISPALKKKWKTYCSEHGLSLTDCIKISMRLLEDMEKKNAVSLEDGILSYLG